jgi:hypothetical protein
MIYTLDIYAYNIKKIAYIFVTTYYIDEDFALFYRTLHVKHVHDENIPPL